MKRTGVLVFVLLTVFTALTAGAGAYDIKSVYYYEFGKDGKERLRSREIYFNGEFTEEQKAAIVFINLFEAVDGYRFPFIPDGTVLYDLRLRNGLLQIDVSGEINGYGGTENERYLIKQIILTAAGFAGAERVTLYIDHEPGVLSEGGCIIERAVRE